MVAFYVRILIAAPAEGPLNGPAFGPFPGHTRLGSLVCTTGSGRKLAEYVASPADILTLGPKLALGSLATIPKRINTL